MKPSEPGAAGAATAKTSWIEDVLTRAEKGDQSVLPQIQEALKSPELAEILGNLAHRVQATIVESVTGGNVAMREALTRKLDGMRTELSGPDPTALERQLVDRIVLSWLAVHDAELRAAMVAELAPTQSRFWEKRIDHAHKRHLSAIKALATVRKLALPAVQVNIARKQINVAGGTAD